MHILESYLKMHLAYISFTSHANCKAKAEFLQELLPIYNKGRNEMCVEVYNIHINRICCACRVGLYAMSICNFGYSEDN